MSVCTETIRKSILFSLGKMCSMEYKLSKIYEGMCTLHNPLRYTVWVSVPLVLNLLGNVLSNLTNSHVRFTA